MNENWAHKRDPKTTSWTESWRGNGNRPEKNRQVLPAVRQHEQSRKTETAGVLGKKPYRQSVMGKCQQNFIKASISVKVLAGNRKWSKIRIIWGKFNKDLFIKVCVGCWEMTNTSDWRGERGRKRLQVHKHKGSMGGVETWDYICECKCAGENQEGKPYWAHSSPSPSLVLVTPIGQSPPDIPRQRSQLIPFFFFFFWSEALSTEQTGQGWNVGLD